jgi:hypothetical protein
MSWNRRERRQRRKTRPPVATTPIVDFSRRVGHQLRFLRSLLSIFNRRSTTYALFGRAICDRLLIRRSLPFARSAKEEALSAPDEVAAGYLLLRPVLRASYMDEALLPDEIVSASECICPQFPDASAIDWVQASDETRFKALDAVGLPAAFRADARTWATDNFDVNFGWPGVFFTAVAANEARRQLFGDGSQVKVIGLGLPLQWVDAFIAEASPPPPADGFAAQGETGYLQMAKQLSPLAAGSQWLGFELLNVEFGQIVHSWLCNGLETHCADALGIRPGANGLIETLESADLCRNEIAREEVGAEPGLWLPWLLVEYV